MPSSDASYHFFSCRMVCIYKGLWTLSELRENISRGSEGEDHYGSHFWIQLLSVNIAEIREIDILIFL